ncbi:tectonic-1-like [Sinocyclocheilus grahami]|uniref:tectonic-1-like n=1 Tax=Sinocyclocheilus grahami TaxID=75366 RepID=UPI0007AD2BA8|nr:PREDICTED: tectonic-1-like [Sinocyclocheilus grahami]
MARCISCSSSCPLKRKGTQTLVDPANLVSYIPVLLESGDVCNNVVQQVKYMFRYSEAGEILNVIASVLQGAIKSITVPIQQEFQITFLQEISSTPVLLFNGNPGYVVGRPLVAGTRTADGIVQSADPKGSLTILQNSGDQDCLLGSSRRSPVLFGIDMVSGCTLKLSNGINCSLCVYSICQGTKIKISLALSDNKHNTL